MNSHFAPQVSVLMTVFNCEPHVREAIQSILKQSLDDYEFIIVDDASKDQTPLVIRELLEKRIVLATINHSGLTKALNYGLRLARGKYIARMDADDIALPERFKRQVEFLNGNPVVGVLGTGYELLLSNGKRLKPRVPLLTRDAEIRKALPKFNPFFHGSVMMRRDILERAGSYDDRFELAQDYELWFRMAKHCDFANLSEVLMLRREGKDTLKKEAVQNWFAIKARVGAIAQGNSNVFGLAHLIRPFFVMITPVWLKTLLRRVFWQR